MLIAAGFESNARCDGDSRGTQFTEATTRNTRMRVAASGDYPDNPCVNQSICTRTGSSLKATRLKRHRDRGPTQRSGTVLLRRPGHRDDFRVRAARRPRRTPSEDLFSAKDDSANAWVRVRASRAARSCGERRLHHSFIPREVGRFAVISPGASRTHLRARRERMLAPVACPSPGSELSSLSGVTGELTDGVTDALALAAADESGCCCAICLALFLAAVFAASSASISAKNAS